MLLKSVQIDHFKHVLNSTVVEIQPDITCLVGKNESGKTAFLEALLRLKFQVQHARPSGHRMLRWTNDTSTSTARNVA